MTTLEPIGDHVVVRPTDAEELTAAGIIIPDVAKEKPQRGEVVAVGAGRFAELTGETVPLTLVPGDEVIYTKYGGSEIEVDDEKLLVLREADVLARAR